MGDKDPVDDLMARFSEALLAKIRASGEKYGYGNAWLENDWRETLKLRLQQHVVKGDPLDVAAYCAFAWHHGWSVTPTDDLRTAAPWPSAADLQQRIDAMTKIAEARENNLAKAIAERDNLRRLRDLVVLYRQHLERSTNVGPVTKGPHKEAALLRAIYAELDSGKGSDNEASGE